MYEIPGYWYRGGTSKCWLFDADLVAPDGVDEQRVGRLLADAFGAADPRQIDGVGGATSTTSKAAIVRSLNDADHDIEYTFAQVGIGTPEVEFGSNCGNCATGIGLYAVTEGRVPVTGDVTTVRMWNTNSNSLLVARVATPGGQVAFDGDTKVPGSDATGVRVDLVFERPGGSVTGALLPTGNARDTLPLPTGGTAAVTMVDAGAPAALLLASDLGLTGAETLDQFAEAVPLLATLRREAALRMGLATPDSPISNAVPKTGIVGPAADYTDTMGRPVRADEHDLTVRMVSMLAPHPAIGLTSAVAVAAAPRDGSVLADPIPARPAPGGSIVLRLGTPAGVVPTQVEFAEDGSLAAVSLTRAARRIATAQISLPGQPQ